MWSWLAKTGKNKNDYIIFLSKYRAKSTYERFYLMAFDCPCCKYTGHDDELNECKCCKKCPIKWKNKSKYGKEAICCLPGSEFNQWNNCHNINIRKENATKILDLAKAIKVK